MDIIESFFTGFLLFFIFTIVGIILLIRFVIKRSRADQPAHVLEKDKKELFEKARNKKGKLIPWKIDYLEKISNDIDFNYVTGAARRFNGYIKNMNGEKLIAFRRLDRGVNSTTSKIVAIGSNFELFYSQREEEVDIYMNATHLGKMIRHEQILDAKDQVIGTTDRNKTSEEYYHVHLNNKRSAYMIKNSERRNILRNPFYDFHPVHRRETSPWYDNENYSYELARLYDTLNENEQNWILALVIYEAVYYGIDFTQ